MSDSPRKTDLLNDTVVGDFANSTDLWDTIEAQVKEWRVSCDDYEGKDLLAFLQGKQLERFLSGAQHTMGDTGNLPTNIVNKYIGRAQNMDTLVANLALALARKTRRLEEIKAICKEDY